MASSRFAPPPASTLRKPKPLRLFNLKRKPSRLVEPDVPSLSIKRDIDGTAFLDNICRDDASSMSSPPPSPFSNSWFDSTERSRSHKQDAAKDVYGQSYEMLTRLSRHTRLICFGRPFTMMIRRDDTTPNSEDMDAISLAPLSLAESRSTSHSSSVHGGATVSTNFCNNQVRPRQRCDVAHSRADHGVRVPALTRPADIAAGTASARAECRDCSTGSRQ